MLILNVSQCNGGRVIQWQVPDQQRPQKGGVFGADGDFTTEAAVTKMLFCKRQMKPK